MASRNVSQEVKEYLMNHQIGNAEMIAVGIGSSIDDALLGLDTLREQGVVAPTKDYKERLQEWFDVGAPENRAEELTMYEIHSAPLFPSLGERYNALVSQVKGYLERE